MTSRGVRVDLGEAEKTRDSLIRREKNTLAEIKSWSAITLKFGRPKVWRTHSINSGVLPKDRDGRS